MRWSRTTRGRTAPGRPTANAASPSRQRSTPEPARQGGAPGSTRPQIAVACQGGGSHAAFTAGVLKALLRAEQTGDYQLMAFSGTSGGAISALLAWHGLLNGGADRAIAMLDGFWKANAATLFFEQLLNRWALWAARLPVEMKGSPYTPPLSWATAQLELLSGLPASASWWGPRRAFVDLKDLLEQHVEFDKAKEQRGPPRLLVGAVDIRSGSFKAFDSAKGEIGVEAILASAALPWLFKAVEIDGQPYWDGLFSQNPPIRNFVADAATAAEKPDQIWVIQINPQQRGTPAESPDDIELRRNELAGNLSLNQEIDFITTVDKWLAEGSLKDPDKFKHIDVCRIEMDRGKLRSRFDLASKLDRTRAFIDELLAHGEDQARTFLAGRPASVVPER
jgi:NTE family protein